MEPKGRGKQIGDKELELMVLTYIANHDSPKESEICKTSLRTTCASSGA